MIEGRIVRPAHPGLASRFGIGLLSGLPRLPFGSGVPDIGVPFDAAVTSTA